MCAGDAPAAPGRGGRATVRPRGVGRAGRIRQHEHASTRLHPLVVPPAPKTHPCTPAHPGPRAPAQKDADKHERRDGGNEEGLTNKGSWCGVCTSQHLRCVSQPSDPACHIPTLNQVGYTSVTAPTPPRRTPGWGGGQAQASKGSLTDQAQTEAPGRQAPSTDGQHGLDSSWSPRSKDELLRIYQPDQEDEADGTRASVGTQAGGRGTWGRWVLAGGETATAGERQGKERGVAEDRGTRRRWGGGGEGRSGSGRGDGRPG